MKRTSDFRTLLLNIFAKTIRVSKPFLPVHMGPMSRDTVPLKGPHATHRTFCISHPRLKTYSYSPQPTPNTPQPTANSSQPTTHSPHPTPHSPQPATHSPHPTPHPHIPHLKISLYFKSLHQLAVKR